MKEASMISVPSNYTLVKTKVLAVLYNPSYGSDIVSTSLPFFPKVLISLQFLFFLSFFFRSFFFFFNVTVWMSPLQKVLSWHFVWFYSLLIIKILISFIIFIKIHYLCFSTLQKSAYTIRMSTPLEKSLCLLVNHCICSI